MKRLSDRLFDFIYNRTLGELVLLLIVVIEFSIIMRLIYART